MSESRIKHIAAALFVMLLGIVAGGCDNDVFIKPLRVSTEEVTLDAAHREAHIDVSGDDWQLGSSSSLPVQVDGDYYYIDQPTLRAGVRRTSHGLDLSLDRYIGLEPYELTLIIAGDYASYYVNVTLMPTDTVEVLGVDYTLNSWGTFPPYSRTDVLSEVHYLNGLSESKLDLVAPDGVPSGYCFEPLLTDPLAEVALSVGATVPLPSVGDYIWDWQLAGDTGVLASGWTPVILRHFPPVPPSMEVPVGVPVAVKVLCDYECCSFQCVVRIRAGGEETSFIAHLNIEMPVRIYCTYEILS